MCIRDRYNAYVFIGNELKSARFKNTVHQVCMSHAKNKFVKASNQGSEPVSYTHLDVYKSQGMDSIKDAQAFKDDFTTTEYRDMINKSLFDSYYYIPQNYIYQNICDYLEQMLLTDKYDIKPVSYTHLHLLVFYRRSLIQKK